ncbi:hypothetical protein LVJ82_04995 [Vitreoscilla massiliensis]|uniref:Uncharacterized protein n=1 Tax=Vitreoscilla massiliensis TaxID=1689272 RepID=A0ABY4E3H9_9NEIS|nr:hypothetical protein [Vitreoscilla massiliensis]UOO90341.1 hypothetical protein LVJ82_04995 [Vitreoscilla massiliensis]
MQLHHPITAFCADEDGQMAPLLLLNTAELPATLTALLGHAYEGEDAFYLLADDGYWLRQQQCLHCVAAEQTLLTCEIADAAWLQAASEAGYCVCLLVDSAHSEHDLANIATWDFARIKQAFQHETWLDVVVVCVQTDMDNA